MNRTVHSRFVSFLLVLAMVFTMLPVSALAADEAATYKQITTAEELTSGQYVMVASNGYAPTVLDGTWVLAEAVTATDGVVTDPAANQVWTLTVDGTTVKLTDSNGVTIAPKGGNTNGIASGDYSWAVTCTDGAFQFAGQGDDTVLLASNTGSENKFRGYKTTTISGNPNGYPCDFSLYKLEEDATTDPSEEPSEDPSEEPSEDPSIDPSVDPSVDPSGPSGEVKEYVLTDTLAAGDEVMIYNAGNTAVLTSVTSGYKLAGETLIPDNNRLYTDVATQVWTVGVNEDGTYTFSQGDLVLGMVQSGSYVNMSTNAADGNTSWALEYSSTQNVFFLRNTGIEAGSYGPYYLEYYNGFTPYASSKPTDSQYGISFYKLNGEEPPVCTPIADAVAGEDSASFTVRGVVTLVDAKNIYVQDSTGGICVRMTDTPSDIALGDTIIGTGTKTTYNGLPQLGSGTYKKSGGLTLSAKEVTIGALTTADLCTYISLKGVEVTEVFDNSGAYTAPNITVTDGTDSIQLYKAVVGKTDGTNWDVQVGDTIDILAAVSCYNTTLQLRNTLSTEITVVASGEGEEPTDPTDPVEPEVAYAEKMTALPNNGDTIIIYNSGNAMGSAASGSKLAGVAATVTDNLLPIDEAMAQLLVTIDESGNYIFTLDGQYLTSAETGNGLSFAAELTDCGKWTAEAATEGSWYLKNVGANYNGNYNQAMEYYSGFTTYGIKETAIYQMELYLVAAAEPEDDGTGKITSAEQFTTGTYAMVVEGGYAMGALDGTWVSAVQPVIEGDKVIDAKGGIWTLTVNGTNVQITDSNGAAIKPKGGNNNGISSGTYDWAWTFDEATQTFTFAGQGSDTVTLASNANEDPTYGGFHKFRAYKNTTISGNPSTYPCSFTLYRVAASEVPETALPAAGDQVVIYNLSAQGVLAAENDTQSIENALAEIVDGKAVPANGAVVFTVEVNGDYYRFHNETYGYLCSNGTGNNAFYSLEASEDADWTLTSGKSGGYNMESRTAKYNGTYSQYLEYYADAYKTYSMYNVTDYDIYEFFFYGVADGVNLTGGIVNVPDIIFLSNPSAYLGQDYTATFSVDAVFGVETLVVTATAGDVSYTLEPTEELGIYTVTLTAEQIQALFDASKATGMPSAIFALSMSGTDTKGVEFANGGAIDILDLPTIGDVTPEANTETGDDKKPVISAEIINAGEDATVTMTVNGEAVEAVYADGVVTYTPAEDMADGRTTVQVTVTRADGETVEKIWSFTVGEAQFQLYFGQLHSHTTYSDGSGSLESALDYIAALPESANVDFVAFTDHSNYFDASGAANPEGALYDMSLATADSQALWSAYVGAMKEFNASQSNVIAVPGFEMTWSGGPGHINTFNTPGIVSRNNTTLNNKTSDAGMKAYYALLSQAEGAESISQFNHPGSTFGTFTDFAYWDALIDTRIQLVEVGNGEGQIGAGGYYPSYEYYTMALDKGWHVAPTNNQDNHKGKWGNANDARDVILTDDFSEEGIYAAIRAMRMYATEDKNLEVGYSVNGQLLGSTISEVPESLTLDVTVYDPDASDSISKVEVIVNSGKVAHTWSDPSDLADGALTVTLDPAYSYYYIRVTEGDGDLAVTAPVWVGEMLKLGISAVETATSTPVTDEELTITTTLFNSEASDATVTNLVYTVGDEVIGTDATGYTVGASSTASVDFKYTPTAAKITTVTVTAFVEQGGNEYTFTMDITLDVQDASKLVYIGIDASHYNEYVNGNYKDSMGNFSQLAAEYNVRTVTLYESADLIAACGNDKYVALILTAPSRRSAEAQAADPLKVYTAEELAAIKAFNEAGGTVILAGWSDHYENYPAVESIAGMAAEEHMAATQNAVLEALGSSLRIGDDATYDDDYNGGQAYRLYFNSYNFDNFLVEGVEVDPENPHNRLYTEVFSHYGGASVYTVPTAMPATVSPVVFGHSGTYSVDVDGDGLGGDSMPKYAYAEGDDRLMIMATEQLPGQGLIIVSGAAFMSNFEVQATIEDSGSEKNYSNYRVCENLLRYLNPVTISTIAEVRAQTEVGYKYTIEGVVTSNASGYDKDTAFFDCIYVQDATGGICCFPVAGNYKIGDKVRITGTTEFYQGEPELQVTSIEVIGEGTVEPTEVTAAEINDRSAEGKLVKISGTVESFELANGLVQTILVKDAEGNVARVFIDGYITTTEDVKDLAVGAQITAVGLASYDDTFNAPEGPFPRIRIRDRADVVCTAPTEPDEPVEPKLEGVIRVAGADRIETSLKLADQLKEALGVEKFEAVVVASGLNYPDALTGSYLAAVKNAPILLTAKGWEDDVNAYIKANLAENGTVYVLGGTSAVPEALVEGLTGVKRLAGDDRFGTNLAILEEAGVNETQEILICTATGFADSLAASASGLPILLVHGSLTAEQKDFLATTSKDFVIIGGEAAVSADLAAELDAIGDVERVGGENRYKTSVLVAQRFVAEPDAVILAYARNYPDGLCGGPLAYALNASLILTDNYDPSAADGYVDGISAGVVVGGEGLISDASAKAIFDLTADAQIIVK